MKKHRGFWFVIFGMAILFSFTTLRAAAAPLSTIIVTNNLDETSDGNGCSLREAITNSNDNAATFPDCAAGVGKDNIVFDISAGGLQTINVTGTPLPEITDPVSIDATTQPGCDCGPLIELNGSAAGGDANGLLISAGGTLIRGFIINQFLDNGILMENSGNNRIEGNYIGTDVSGTLARPNGINGIAIDSDNNIIGGTVAPARNLISGNASSGVAIPFGPRQGNVIEGNYIGTDVYGTAGLPNGVDGVSLVLAASGNTIGGITEGTGNLISGNIGNGVSLVDQLTVNNIIAGNYIGLDATGTKPLGNGRDGIFMADGPENNTIGGSVAAARNLISGNGQHGIEFNGQRTHVNLVSGNYIGTDVTGSVAIGNAGSGVFSTDSASNAIGSDTAAGRNIISGNVLDGITIQGKRAIFSLIRGNYIGTDVSGMIALKNQQEGVHITGAANTHVGGNSASDGNVISANTIGVLVDGADAVGTLIENNYIGTAADGISALGNFNEGIFINGAPGSFIGETTTGTGNVIAFNHAGIVIGSSPNDEVSVGNQMLGNSIHDNEILGIDLGFTEAVVPNDVDDPDLGPNRLQNFPVITVAQNQPSAIHIEGTLDSASTNSAYPVRIEFFSSPSCDSSGYGEGQTFLGFTSVAAPGSFVNDLSVTVPDGSQLTATATDANANTSEFSACTPVTPVQPPSSCLTALEAPTILNPTSGSRLTVQNVPLDWTDVKCAVTYKIVVKQGSQSGPRVDRQGGLTDSNTVTKTLPRNNKYFFRVRACNPVSCGPWTPYNKFRIGKAPTP